jgi:hypothetical protein
VHTALGFGGALFEARVDGFAHGAKLIYDMRGSGVGVAGGGVSRGADLAEAFAQARGGFMRKRIEIAGDGLAQSFLLYGERRRCAFRAAGDVLDGVDALIEFATGIGKFEVGDLIALGMGAPGVVGLGELDA